MPKEEKPPTKLADVFKSKDLTEKFEEFCKKEHTLENFTFYLLKSWNAQNAFKIYFARGAKYELNLPNTLLDKARELGAKKAWDDKQWKDIMKDSKDEVFGLMEKDTFRRFLKEVKAGAK